MQSLGADKHRRAEKKKAETPGSYIGSSKAGSAGQFVNAVCANTPLIYLRVTYDSKAQSFLPKFTRI